MNMLCVKISLIMPVAHFVLVLSAGCGCTHRDEGDQYLDVHELKGVEDGRNDENEGLSDQERCPSLDTGEAWAADSGGDTLHDLSSDSAGLTGCIDPGTEISFSTCKTKSLAGLSGVTIEICVTADQLVAEVPCGDMFAGLGVNLVVRARLLVDDGVGEFEAALSGNLLEIELWDLSGEYLDSLIPVDQAIVPCPFMETIHAEKVLSERTVRLRHDWQFEPLLACTPNSSCLPGQVSFEAVGPVFNVNLGPGGYRFEGVFCSAQGGGGVSCQSLGEPGSVCQIPDGASWPYEAESVGAVVEFQ